MNIFESLRIIALKAAWKPDSEAIQRSVMRWYSKTFHTPLHQVYDLPVEDVWMAYFEEGYANAERADLEEEIERLNESPEVRRKRLAKEEVERINELEFERMAHEANQKASEQSAQTVVQKASEMLPAAPVVEPEVEMTFVDDKEFEKLLEGGFANQTKTQ